MNESQIIALSITVPAILGATLINNARIGDMKDVIRAETNSVARKWMPVSRNWTSVWKFASVPSTASSTSYSASWPITSTASGR